VRIEPLHRPYPPDVAEVLASMMPPGIEPIALFRTFARNLPMARAMQPWGSYELGRRFSVSLRHREIVIDRTCARCGCEYEWGVHVAFFAERASLSADQVRSLTSGTPEDPCWDDEADRLLIRLADTLHDSGAVPDRLWSGLRSCFDEAQLLDLTMLCGWYHAISFTARAAQVPLEPSAPRFESFQDDPSGGPPSLTDGT
jgi:alkylhydroperoxidase family enzyme